MYISKHLLEDEYRCRCCSRLPPNYPEKPHVELFMIFDDIREGWDKPIAVSSGYRCTDHNTAIGGVPWSIHIFGLALDCLCKEDEVDEFYSYVNLRYPDLRIGKYSWGIHIDIGYRITPRAKKSWIRGIRW